MEPKICPRCGAINPQGAMGCSRCAMPFFAPPPPMPPKKKKKSLKFAKALVLLIVASLMLLSVFTPIITVYVDMEEYGTADMDLAPYDFLILLADNVHFDTAEELQDSKLYIKAGALWEEFRNSISEDEMYYYYDDTALSEYTYTAYRLYLRSEKIGFYMPLLVSAGLSLCYIALVIIVFIFALKALINQVKGKGDTFAKALKRFVLVPFMLGAISLSTNGFAKEYGGAEIGGTGALIMVLSVISLTFFIVARIVEQKGKLVTNKMVLRGATLIVAFMCLGATTSAYLNVDITTNFDELLYSTQASTEIGIDFFGTITKTGIDNVRTDGEYGIDALLTQLRELDQYDVEAGTARDIVNRITLAALVNKMGRGTGVFATQYYVIMLFFAAVSIVAANSIIYMTTGEEKHRIGKIAKITAVCAAGVALIIVVIQYFVLNSAIFDQGFARSIQFYLSETLFEAVIHAVGFLIIPLGKELDPIKVKQREEEKERRRMEEEARLAYMQYRQMYMYQQRPQGMPPQMQGGWQNGYYQPPIQQQWTPPQENEVPKAPAKEAPKETPGEESSEAK